MNHSPGLKGILLGSLFLIFTATAFGQTKVEQIYDEARQVVSGEVDSISTGMFFYKNKDRIKNLEYSDADALKAGLLFNRAGAHDRSVEALTSYLENNPKQENAEIVATLIDSYYAKGRYEKVFALADRFKQKYKDNSQTFTLDNVRLKDRVDYLLLLSYKATGQHQKVIDQARHLINIRDKEQPPGFNFNTSIWSGLAESYAALGQYEEGLNFLEKERAKMEEGSTSEEWTRMYRAFLKYEQIIADESYRAGTKFLKDQKKQFSNKYVLRKLNTKLEHSRLLGEQLPDLAVTDGLNQLGAEFSSNDLEGKVVVLDFWATWCHACRKAFPFMKSLYNKYADQGLEMVGIVAPYGYVATYDSGVIKDLEYDRELELTRKLVDQYEMNFPQIMDRSRKNFDHFKVNALPTIVIADRNGVVREVGHPSKGKIEQMVKNLLEQQL